jgi:hypothetical protein
MDNHLSSPCSIADYLQILTLGGIKFRTSCCYISDSVSHWNLGVGVLFTACFWAATPENARPLPLGGISISGKVKIAGLRATDEDAGGKHQSPTGQNLDRCRNRRSFHVPVADPGDDCKLTKDDAECDEDAA